MHQWQPNPETIETKICVRLDYKKKNMVSIPTENFYNWLICRCFHTSYR